MALPSYKYAAPGSLMLLGEHAVLHHYPALVSAIDQRITVELTPATDRFIHIHSELGQKTYSLDHAFKIAPPFQYIMALIQRYQTEIPQGFTLKIKADFASTVGFGSSSAVTVATLACLDQWLNQDLSPIDFFRVALQAVRQVQGQASGADIAASLFGGIVLFHPTPLSFECIKTTLPNIIALYSGSKMPTAKVIQQIDKQRHQDSVQYQQWFQEIGDIVLQGSTALRQQNWSDFANALLANHQIMCQMHLNNTAIDSITETLAKHPEVLAQKISGSGLGDCVIGLCRPNTQARILLSADQEKQGIRQIPVALQASGLLR